MKTLLIFMALSFFIFSCKKEPINYDKYLIFNSDSSNVFGIMLSDSSIIHPNIAYKVINGQIILFDKSHNSNPNIFQVNIDVGQYNYFSPSNFHYSLKNDFVFTVK